MSYIYTSVIFVARTQNPGILFISHRHWRRICALGYYNTVQYIHKLFLYIFTHTDTHTHKANQITVHLKLLSAVP